MNKKEMDITGVSLWHSLGYKGQGINIANLEHTAKDQTWFNGKFHDPFNISSGYGHGGQVLDIMHQVAPDSNLYILPTGSRYLNGVASGDFVEKTIPFIREHIDIVGQSQSSQVILEWRRKLIVEQHDNSTWLVSAGNGAYDYFNKMAHNNVRIAIGAVHINSRGQINRARYSSVDEELDFMGFSYVNVHNANGTIRKITGTSFSNPFVCGMVALVKQFFYEKTGVRLNQYQVFKFMKDNSIDMGTEGHNEYYGHGLFVLPDPRTIDVYRYIKKEEQPMQDIIGRWSEDAIRELAAKGIMSGYPNGEFKPGKTMTREEYAQATSNLLKYLKEENK